VSNFASLDSPAFTKLLAANANNAAFASVFSIPDLSGQNGIPPGAALIDLDNNWSKIHLRFFGTAGTGLTGMVRVGCVKRAQRPTGSAYTITPVGSYTFTTSPMTGLASGSNPLNTDYIADTITRLNGIGIDSWTDWIINPTGQAIPASVLVNTFNCRFMLIELKIGTATSVNCEWAGAS